MHELIALAIFGILTLVSLIHIYWGFGGLWPARSEAELVRTVIGIEHPKMPGRILTIVVAGLIFLAGYIALTITGTASAIWPEMLNTPLLAILSLVFLLRGFVTYLPIAVGNVRVEPFRSLNRNYYSPLCILLGIGFVILFFN